MKNYVILLLGTVALTGSALAGGEVIAFERGDRGLYHYIPSGGTADANAPSSGRSRTSVFKPTQHYYTKKNVVSYRYSEEAASAYDMYGRTAYLGPHAAVFDPKANPLPPSTSIRNYASIHRRGQPGVDMVTPARAAGRPPVNSGGSATTTITSIKPAAAYSASIARR